MTDVSVTTALWMRWCVCVLWLCYAMTMGSKLKYIWGDALDDPLALGPNGQAYPWDLASEMVAKQKRSSRMSLMFADDDDTQDNNGIMSPGETRRILLSALEGEIGSHRQGRAQTQSQSQKKKNSGKDSNNGEEGCVPSRLCPSTYNTTAPMFGISLTSGKPVTIVQKFPDLLQQVVFQVCKTTECEVLRGECVQTYLPYLFLVIPLGPVTLTGQDYVLVESGCVCRPKYARKHDEPPPIPFLAAFNTSRP